MIRTSRPLVRGRGLKLRHLDAFVNIAMSPACTGAWIETLGRPLWIVARLYGGVD